MNVQKRNGVSIYCLSSGATLPEWLGERARRNLSKKDESVRRRIELIQDFQMPASSTRLVQSNDGRYLMAAGTYPPRIRCYDVHDLTMKFERYLNAGVVDMTMLGEDYGKLAILLDDRTVAFHAPYGAHDAIRIPTFGRAMAYEPTTCELLLAAKGNQLYRMNLEEGRFTEPWNFAPANASANCISVNQSYPLAAVGCDDGIVRFWDNRSPDAMLTPFLSLDVRSATKGCGYADETLSMMNSYEVTSIAQDPKGMYLAAGTASGVVALYDVRSSKPLYIQEHKHGLPVHTIEFHPGSGLVLSADEKLVKCWQYRADKNPHMRNRKQNNTVGSVHVNVESTSKIAHFVMAGDGKDPAGNTSGLLLCATDQPKMESFFLPSVGLAPEWCSFLENITEELEERDLARTGEDIAPDAGQEAVFENYKFVSREDLEKLGISNLVGTQLLKGYMHGFFIDINLYNRVKSVANPFEYEEYQRKKLKERVEARRGSRIAPRANEKKKTAVNLELAKRLERRVEDGKSNMSKDIASGVLTDNRFGTLFTNPDFEIDEEDENFKLRNPSGVAAAKRRRDNLDSDDEESDNDVEAPSSTRPVGYDDASDEAVPEDDTDSSADSDDDGFAVVHGEAYSDLKRSLTKNKPKKQSRTVKMREADDVVDLGLGGGDDRNYRARKRLEEMSLPLAERLKMQDATELRVIRGGNKEIEFVPQDVKQKLEQRRQEERGKRNRRGVKDLGFKTPFKHHK